MNGKVMPKDPIDHHYPDVCPLTRMPFFMAIEYPERGWMPTYGGPYDSYTIPEWDGKELIRYRFDHDEGGWVEGCESVSLKVVDDEFLLDVDEILKKSRQQKAKELSGKIDKMF